MGYQVEIFEKISDPLTTLQKNEGRSSNFLIQTRSFEGSKKVQFYDKMMANSIEIKRFEFILDNRDRFPIHF